MESLAPMLGGLEIENQAPDFFSAGPDRSGSLPVDCLILALVLKMDHILKNIFKISFRAIHF